ncbi:MAG: divalent-cation tolerance protein CutA [bacterium]|nr:divalent-cation tolerance protein CutA [bacterium]
MTLEGERDDVRLVLVTAPDGEVAAGLGRVLVEERLAACVNVVPGLRSIYRWEGEIQDDAEVLLMVKTRADHLDRLTLRVQELHPHDVPEVLALPAVGGSEAYLGWVRSEVSA